jgi:hypothetical protein
MSASRSPAAACSCARSTASARPKLLRLTVGSPSEVEALVVALADARRRC